MKNSRYPSIYILVLAAAAIIVFLHTYQLPDNTRSWKAIGDAGHVPVFGLLSIILLIMSYQTLRTRINKPLWHYLIALLLTTLVGSISEIVQIFGARDADIVDLARDFAGALAFLGIYFLIDRQTVEYRSRIGLRGRSLIWAGCVATLILAIYHLGLVTAAYAERDKAFPAICTFDASWEKTFWIRQDTEVEVVEPPEGWMSINGTRVGRLTFNPVTYPGFHIQEPYPDWRGYSLLSFDIFSDLDTTVSLYFRLHDTHHNKDFKDRYNNQFVIEPGLNQISIPVEDIENAPAGRKMDLTNIRTFGIFAYRPPESFYIYLDNFRLK